MNKDFNHTLNSTPPVHRFLPVLTKTKSTYIIWFEYYNKLDKVHRYTLGARIDNLFIEIIEAIAFATYLEKTEKQPWVRLAIRKLDTVKVLMMVLWETKSIDSKKYIFISEYIEEVGKMLGGWHGQITKTLRDIGEKKK